MNMAVGLTVATAGTATVLGGQETGSPVALDDIALAVFDTRGVAYAAWTLTAFCLGVFLGTLIRRVLPAMATRLGCFAALAALTVLYLQHHYPVSTFWPRQLLEAGWLLALSALLVAGTIRLVRYGRGHASTPRPAPGRPADACHLKPRYGTASSFILPSFGVPGTSTVRMKEFVRLTPCPPRSSSCPVSRAR
jgi:hypothetical protein